MIAAITVSGTLMSATGIAVMAAENDPKPEETVITGQEVAPAVLRTDLELEYYPTVEDEKYDPVISGVVVAPAPKRTDLEMEFTTIADPSIEYSVSTGMVIPPPVFRPEPESEYAAMIEKENRKDDSIIRGEEVSQALVRTSDGEFVVPTVTEPAPEVIETQAETEIQDTPTIPATTQKKKLKYIVLHLIKISKD